MTRQDRRKTHAAAFAALLFASIVAAGCSWNTGRGQTETTPMHERFSRTVDIQTGIVLGDLERAKSAAAWIATQDGSRDFPAGTEAYQDRLRSRAGLIAMDEELDSAALHTAEIAAVCGNCHLATGGGPRFVIGSEPGQGSTAARQMIRHLWAADRMWEGLVGPSAETWMAGIGVLNEGEEGLEGVVRSSDAPEEARRYLADLRNLAEEGAAATTQEARASIYGRLLATCYGCHRSVGVAGAG